MQLKDFKILTFDCYGTLIDWETGILTALQPLTDRLRESFSHDYILETHAYYESTQQAQTPAMCYRDILSIVYKRLAEEWQISVPWQECLQYGSSVQHWPAFPDSTESLKYLKQYYKLVILSNVDNQSFAASNEKLAVTFDAVYTAEDVGSYKPANINFSYLLNNLQQLGVEKSDILHTAESMFHDHKPANYHELHSCWIYRRHAKQGFGATLNPGEMPKYDFQFNSMEEMVQAHQAE